MLERTTTVLCIGAICALYASCGFDVRADRFLLETRATEGMFWGSTRWHACPAPDTTRQIAGAVCAPTLNPGSRRFTQLSRVTRELETGLQRDSSAETLRLVALASMQWQQVTPASLNRAAELLALALERRPADARLLNDLAVVQLEIANRDQNLDALLRALDAIELAVELDSARSEIRFNLALILERLHLLSSAKNAWRRYSASDPPSTQRTEAQQHETDIQRRLDAPRWPRRTMRSDLVAAMTGKPDLARLAQQFPDAARDYVFTVVLPDWANAVVAHDPARATSALAPALQIAAALEQLQADQSLAHVLAHLQKAAGNPDAYARLAADHLAYTDGFKQYSNGFYDQAAATLAAAAQRLRAVGSPMSRWAAYYQAGSLANRSNYDDADELFRQTIADAPADEPALIGRSTWSLGVTQLRRGNPEAAARRYHEAVPYVAAAKEPESLGALSLLLAEAHNMAGFRVSTQTEALAGLKRLSRFRESHFLNNHLTIVAGYARKQGWNRSAAAIMSEVQEVAVNLENPGALARALRARASDRIRLGRVDLAIVDLDSARRVVQRMPAGIASQRAGADVGLVYGQLLIRNDPAGALSLLADAVQTFNRLNIGVQQIVAEYQAARAAKLAGNNAEMRRYLQLAIDHVEQRRARFETAESRFAMFETVESVFDDMIGLELADGRSESALRYLEQSRTADQPEQNDVTAVDFVFPSGFRVPNGTVLLDYALLDSVPVLFIISTNRIREHWIAVNRDSLGRLSERVRAEIGQVDASAQATRAALHDLLIAPAAPELKGASRIVVVPDRELHALPFAALRDRHRSQYLIEQYEISTVPSIAFYRQSIERGRQIISRNNVVIVGNPEVGPELQSELPGLKGAEQEATQIAAIYPKATLKLGAAATRAQLSVLLEGASIFHFAGHAVFDPYRPEMSYLAVAGGSEGAESAWRTQEIRTLRLSTLKTVVLSACSTLNARPIRTGPLAGVAHAFISAGAASVITTLWPAEDRSAIDIAVAIHHEMAQDRAPGAALRAAQLAALRSENPGQRAPAVWANFIYSGY